MTVQQLIIVRGLPGAGKSTIAARFGAPIREADKYPGMYTYRADGEVVFHGSDRMGGIPMIVLAHKWCQDQVDDDLEAGFSNVVVANTFVSGWEFTPYLKIAEKHGARIVVVDLFDGGMTDEELSGRNVHGVPADTIARMRESYEHDWRAGDPRPPWERDN